MHTQYQASPWGRDVHGDKASIYTQNISPLHAVFLEFPSNAMLLSGENATLTCVVKATEGAVVQWLLDGQPLPLVEDSAVCGDSSNSNGTVVSESSLPGNFALFHAELTVRCLKC